MIAAFGGPGKLSRNGTLRDCVIGDLTFDPRRRDLVIEGKRIFLIAALFGGVEIVEPHHEQDLVVAFGETLRIVEPVRGPRPGGSPIFFEVTCEYL
jgi:hypothetical protein